MRQQSQCQARDRQPAALPTDARKECRIRGIGRPPPCTDWSRSPHGLREHPEPAQRLQCGSTMAVAARQKAHLRLVRDEPPETSPVEIPALSAGIKGGLAGGLAMAIMWMLQGALSGQGVWYP